MSISIEHDILWLEIAVNNPELMNVLQGQHHLSRINAHILLRESHFLAEMLGQILALAVFQSQVDVARSLEGEMQGDDERMLDLLEDVHLGYHKLGLLAQNDLLLGKSLKSVVAAVSQALHQEHLPERSLAQLHQHFEVTKSQRLREDFLISHAGACSFVVLRLRLGKLLFLVRVEGLRGLERFHRFAERESLREEIEIAAI